MALPRTVNPETLDVLPVDDPAARHSRGDLRRVHRVMGTRKVLLRVLRELAQAQPDAARLRVLELGAGDGSLMLRVAQAWPSDAPPVALTLLDRQPAVSAATLADYEKTRWTAALEVVDVLDWAAQPAASAPRWQLIVANLFLHHFEGEQLAAVLAAAAARSDRFFACEPRRDWISLVGSHLIIGLGANAVTRQDAVLSVHAGFRDAELTAHWPVADNSWQLHEYTTGLFSHCFRAERSGAA